MMMMDDAPHKSLIMAIPSNECIDDNNGAAVNVNADLEEDDDLAIGRYETSYSKLAAASSSRSYDTNGGATRRGRGYGVVSAIRAEGDNTATDTAAAAGDGNRSTNRSVAFDRLDLDDDADLFAMIENEEENEVVMGEDIFLDNDNDDVEEKEEEDDDNDDAGVAEEEDDNNDNYNVARDRMQKDQGEEGYSSGIASDDDDDDRVEEFEAFRESAATGRRRRQRRQKQQLHYQPKRDESPSTPNPEFVVATATNPDKNSNQSPKSSSFRESVSVVNESLNPPPPPLPPTKTQLLQLVDNLFSNISDVDTMTVGGINRSVASHYGWEKVDKPRRLIIKERLTLLIMGKVKPGGGKSVGMKKQKNETETNDEDEENNDDDHDDNHDDDKLRKKTMRSEKKKEKIMQKKKKMMKKSIKTSKKYSKARDEADEDGNIGHDDKATDNTTNNESENSDMDSSGDVGNDSSSDYEEHAMTEKDSTRRRRDRDRRSSMSKASSGKMAKHLRDQHAKARRRQMEEARIRREELGHLADHNNELEMDSDEEEDVTKEGTMKKKVLLSGDVTKEEAEDDSKIQKLSEEDRQRAQAIAARFDTNRDELRVKRIEDRVGLIDRLRTKRLELISSSLSQDEDDGMTIADLAEKLQKEDDVVDRPKLTSTNVIPNANDTKNVAVNDDDEKSSSNSNEDDSDEEESEDDLEIIAQQPSSTSGGCSNLSITTKIQKRISTVDLLFQQMGNQSSIRKDPRKVSKPPANPRMALQNTLRAKVLSSGNRWLARELGYKDEDDHIRDCKEVEEKKRKQILFEEKEAALRDRERETALLRSQMLEEDDNGFVGEIAREDAMKMLGASDLSTSKYDEEEDEEMAMARELEQLEDGADGDEGYDEGNGEDSNAGESFQELVDDELKSPIETMVDGDIDNNSNIFPTVELEEGISTSSGLPIQSMILTPSRDNLDEETSVKRTGAGDFHMLDITSDVANDTTDSLEVNNAPNVSRSSRENSLMGEEDGSPETDQNRHDCVVATNLSNDTKREEKATSKKPKNSAWQAILLKEKAAIAKEKRRQRKNGGLVEAEAEEEEEEEGIVGLEDFGFAVSKKKDDDDDDDGEVDQDDLDHVVDDLSDGEGDEEAGEVARKRLEQAEEKERHKEIIRRMREGYDGRRGGIASGIGGARGTLRFDQLVAADNRDDAKRLGLLNDDELNSDDEQDDNKDSTNDDEEEDEAALLDKMLKERFLNRDDDIYADENFTDDEESDDDADGTEQNNANEDDDDNREQDRLAKYFEKRARRNRILEEFEGDTQFSRSRLIDEDVSMQQDLKTMKTLFCRKRSVESSNLDFKENNGLSKKQKKEDSREDNATKSTSGLFLSVLANRRGAAGRKRTTTFVSGKEMKSSFSRSHRSSLGKSVALTNHVVFVAGDNSQSTSQLPDTTVSRASFLGAVSRGHTKDSKVARSGAGCSLWTKVCSKNFR